MRFTPSKMVVLTGAGISAESGIQTFRGQDGLWEGHSIEDVATPEGFASNPQLVIDFYNTRREQLYDDQISPNSAHRELASFQDFCEIIIITQNVDDLHERAGSTNVIHMHGELKKMKCALTSRSYLAPIRMNKDDLCDCCKKAYLRPDIVWFGEMPYHMDVILEHLETCDLFVSIGTSGQVYPAAGFVQRVSTKVPKVEINMEQTSISDGFNHRYKGKATESVKEFLEDVKSGQLRPNYS